MTEHDHQVDLIGWAIKNKIRFPQLDMLYAIPNGGHRSAIAGAKLKAEGVRRGVPDLCLPVPSKGFHGLYVELKVADKSKGRVSPEQKEWIHALSQNGYMAVVCHGWEAAAAAIEGYLS